MNVTEERADELRAQAEAFRGKPLQEFPADLLLEMSVGESLDATDDDCARRLCNHLWSALGRDDMGISRCWMYAIDCGEAREGDAPAEPDAVYAQAEADHKWLNGFSVAGLITSGVRRVIAALDGEDGGEPQLTDFERNLNAGLRYRAENGPWFAHEGKRYVFFTCNCS